MELFIHQITLLVAMLAIPYCISWYAKGVFRPERGYNGKISWVLLAVNVMITLSLVWTLVLYIMPGFAHYVMLIAVRNPPSVSFAGDVMFLSIMMACLIVFLLKRRSRKERWQAGRSET